MRYLLTALFLVAAVAQAQAQATVATLCNSSGTWVPCSAVSAVTNAGTFVVQENGAALTALQLIDNIPITIGSTTSGQSGALIMGAVTTAAPTYTTAQSAPLSLTTAGLLRVAIEAGAGSGGTAQTDGAVFTAGTTSETPIGGLYQSAVGACVDGRTCAAGMTTGRAIKVALSNADGSLATYATDMVEDAAETAGGSGPMVISVRRDTLASSAGASGDNATFNTNATGALYTQPTAGTSGGADAHSRISAGLTEDEHEVKATAGTLYSVTATNANAAVRFLKCANNTAAGTTPGTTTPTLRLAIPAAGAGFSATLPVGYAFSTGLTCWIVTGAADADVAEVAANELMVFYTFK